MIHKLINMLNISLYSEPDFFINKLDETHFSVKARNGLNATITINDRIMFVDTSFEHARPFVRQLSYSFSDMEKSVVRYSTPMNESSLSFDDFVIKSITSTILFKIKKNRLSTYFEEHDDFFKDIVSEFLYNKLIAADLEPIKFLNYDQYVMDVNNPESHCLYDYKFLDKKCYPMIHFNKKKVIGNVFKYSFYAEKPTNMAKKEKVVAYYIDGVFFNLCDLKTFFLHKAIKDKYNEFGYNKFNFNTYTNTTELKIFYGINNQLTDNHSFLSKHIDLSKVQVLRRDGQQYCLLKKENRQLTLSYITNFDIEKTVVDGVLTYSSWWKKMMRNETPLRRYKNEHLITYSYIDGKLTKKTVRFDLNMVTKHEMNISNQAMANIDYLKTHYPSDFIVNRLNDFGICSDIPLSLNDLSVLEMCEI